MSVQTSMDKRGKCCPVYHLQVIHDIVCLDGASHVYFIVYPYNRQEGQSETKCFQFTLHFVNFILALTYLGRTFPSMQPPSKKN